MTNPAPPRRHKWLLPTLLFGVAAVVLGHEFKYGADPGKTPKGVDYLRPRAVRAPSMGGKSSFRFAVFGDWGMRSTINALVTEGLQTFQKKYKKRGQGLDAVFLSGDNFYSKGVDSLKDPRWETLWGKPFRKLDVPFYVSLGNHDYGNGPDNAQLQVDKSGTPGFENWVLRDVNGPHNPGIYHDQWFVTERFAVHAVFIDSNLLMWKGLRVRNRWASQLQWLDETLDERPKKIGERRVVKIVVAHHPVACFGEKESEIEFINSKENAVGPGGRTLKQILVAKADAYVVGHAHAVQFIDLKDAKVIPPEGPIHGRTRQLESRTVLQLVSGTAGQVRQKSSWADSCYYVARLPGFTVMAIEVKKDKLSMAVHFVDCSRGKDPRVIYSLVNPLGTVSPKKPS